MFQNTLHNTCILIFQRTIIPKYNIFLPAGISCESGRCKDWNAKNNMQRVGASLFNELLSNPPSAISRGINELKQSIMLLNITANQIIPKLKGMQKETGKALFICQGLWKVFKVRYQIERYANIHVHVESSFIWYGVLHFINQLSIPFLGRSEVRKNKQWVGKITCTFTKHGRLFYHVLTLFYYTLEWI